MVSKVVPVSFFVVCVALPVLGLPEVGSGIVGDFYWKMIRIHFDECCPGYESANIIRSGG